jgi:hypothetical protein
MVGWSFGRKTNYGLTVTVSSKPPADIFTKEMRDGAHFRRLRDSFMSRLSDFLQDSLLAVHHARQLLPTSLVPAAARVALSAGVSSYFTALASSSFCRNITTISHLCSAGRQLLRGLHGFVPSSIIWHFVPGVFELVQTLFLVLLLFSPGIISLVHPKIFHLWIPPSFRWCFCLGRTDGGC